MLTPGARFERYTIQAHLGQGGMGEVYRAFDPRLERRVALKILRADDDPSAGSKDSAGRGARLLREARAAAALDHPNVVAIFDVGEVDGTTFVAMELIEGRTLRALIHSDVPIATRLGWLVDLATALAFAHRRGLVHRDIKPENVMIREDGVLKVLDFGIARRARSVPTAQTVPESFSAAPRPTGGPASTFAGTPHYMAPEQMQSLSIDGRADQFAWGVVAYELLTDGRMPWPGASDLVGLISSVLGRPAEPLPAIPELSPAVAGVIARALERDADDRFPTMGELLDALGAAPARSVPVGPAASQSAQAFDPTAATIAGASAFQARAPAPTAVSGLTTTLRAPHSRSPTLWILGGLGIAAAAIVAFLLLRGGDAPEVDATTTANANARVDAGIRRSLAVLGFKNLSGNPETQWIGTALVETMSTELAMGEQLRTIAADDVERMKRELAIGDADRIDRDVLSQVGRRLGADLIVTGSYLAVGGKLRLDVRLVDAANGETLTALSESVKEDDLIDMVARTGSTLRRELRLAELSADEASGVRASQPGTIEGARLYAEGLTRLRNFDNNGARETLERLVSLEPGFAPGHVALADALTQLGMREAAGEAARRAMDLSKPLRREEQMSIEVRYYEATEAWDRAIEAARALHERYPDNLDHGLRLAAAQSEGGAPKDAITTLSALRRLPGPLGDDPRIELATAYAYMTIGDLPASQRAAEAAIEKATKVGARTLAARAEISRAWALFSVGESDRARELFLASLAEAEALGDPVVLVDALNDLAVTHYFRGETDEALQRYAEAAKVVHELGNRSWEADLNTNVANLNMQLGRLDAAERALPDPESQLVPQTRANIQVDRAMLELLRGDPRRAHAPLAAAVDGLRAIGDDRGLAWALSITAEVGLAEGHLDESESTGLEALALRERHALTLFAAQSRLHLARVAHARGRHDDAIDGARAAATTMAAESAGPDEARAQALIARALIASGRSAEAAQPLARARELSQSTPLAPLRIEVATVGALFDAAEDPDGARRRLDEDIAEASRMGLTLLALDARLARARLDLAGGRAEAARAELGAIADEARGRGLGLYADQAIQLRDGAAR